MMVGESCDVFAIQVLAVQTFAVSCVNNEHPGTYLFIKVPYLSRPGNSERTFLVFESSCHLLLPFSILTTKGKGNPATYLQLKETTSELVCLFLHYFIYYSIYTIYYSIYTTLFHLHYSITCLFISTLHV